MADAPVTPPTDAVTPPTTDAVTPPTDAATPPTTAVTPPTDAVTPPTDAATPPTTAVTPPTDAVTPPTEAATPPTDAATPPIDAATPPTDAVTPPTDAVTPPTSPTTDTVTPPTDAATPPTDAATPPTDAVTPPTDAVTPPTDAATPPTDAVTPPTDAATPPTDAATPPIDAATPPTDDVTPPTDVVTPRTSDLVAEDERKLKYLDFVQVAAIYVIACFSTLYEYAKGNSGPLKPGVQAVEDTVITVIGPVYDKFHNVPFDLLKFIDLKVADLMTEVDSHMPSLLKQASSQALFIAHKAPEIVRDLAGEVHHDGLVDTASNVAKTLYTKYEPTAKELYAKYEPVAEKNAVSVWRSLNKLPLFPQVAQILVPTAAYWSEKYNQAVTYASERGVAAAHYFPIIPIERIAKVFEGGAAAENEQSVSMNDGTVASAQ